MDASDLLILAGSCGAAAYVGHFFGLWAVLLAVSVAVLIVGLVAARNGH